jgi:hypothetical protein
VHKLLNIQIIVYNLFFYYSLLYIIHSFIYSFICSFIYSLIYSFIYLLFITHLLIYSFIYLFIPIPRAKSLLCLQLLDAGCRANAGSNRVMRALGDNRRFISAVSRCIEAGDAAAGTAAGGIGGIGGIGINGGGGIGDNSFSQHNNSSLLASPGQGQGQGQGQGHREVPSASQGYVALCALSFCRHVRRTLLADAGGVAAALAGAGDALRLAASEGQGQGQGRGRGHRLNAALSEACARTDHVFSCFDTVRACVAVSSSPLLLRLVLFDARVLSAAGEVLRAIKPTQVAFHHFSRLWRAAAGEEDMAGHSAALLDACQETIASAEQVT